MNKKIIIAWIVFLMLMTLLLFVGNRVIDKPDESITKQYKITINDHSIAAARDDRTHKDESKLEEVRVNNLKKSNSDKAPQNTSDTVTVMQIQDDAKMHKE